MPRVARSNVSLSKPNNARKKSQKRTLDAFSIASHSAPDTVRVPRHRLGDSAGFEPRQKRRRLQDDGEGDDEDDQEHASNARRLQRKAVAKRNGAGGLDKGADEGSDSEGNEWRMGGPIGEDSDSSLDSDEAFGESDDERFDGFTFRGSSTTKGPAKKKKKQPVYSQEMDLDEGGDDDADSEEEDDFGDAGVDLATMLDYNSDDDSDGEETQPKKKLSKSSRNGSDEGDEEEEEEDDDDDDDDDDDADSADDESDSEPSEAEYDDDDPTKLSKLQDLVASLEQDQPEKRIGSRTQDAHEFQQPSAYGLSTSQKLKISDLLPTVTDPALRKSLKLLSSDKSSKRSGVPGKLDAPLPKRQQDRLDRSAATQKAKETLDRWRDTVVHNRRAEFLQFPLKDPNASEPVGASKMIPVQQDKPQNDLESAIQNILEESGLSAKQKKGRDEEQLQQFEELQMNKMPIEEVMARRAELRKARELLFREEVKAKRVKKIKSKAYRRVHRKERERAEATEQALLEAEGVEPDEDEKDRIDRRRAEERMGAKHRESKWAKGMKKSGRTVWDEDARDGIIDMARRNEELRRRIEGKDVDEHSDDSDVSISDDDDDDEEMDDDEAERSRLTKKIDKLGAKDGVHSKIGSMGFMLRAEAARKAQNDEDIERMRRELADEQTPSEEEPETAVGRRSFGPKAKNGAANKPKPAPRGELEEQPASDEEDRRDAEDDVEIITDRPAQAKPTPQPKKSRSFLKNAEKVVPDDDDEPSNNNDENEWLTAPSKNKKRSKKQQVDESVLDLSKPAPSKGNKAQPVEASKPAAAAAAAKESAAPSTNGWTTVAYGDDQSGNDDDDGDEAKTADPMLAKDKQSMLHQRAFAGDDVAVDFEAEKEAQAADEDAKVESSFLPGWGSWAGDGLTKAVRKQNRRAAHNPLLKRATEGVRAADRKDAGLRNVVISEAQQRKGKKYLASNLPHQFERREQYERSLRIPVGPEWTTKETFQRSTRPRVVVKQGIVAPMEKPLL